MIISHKHKFIFIKTKKTAGTSIEIALSKYCGADDVLTPIGKADSNLRNKLGYTCAQNYKTQPRFKAHTGAKVIRRIMAKDVWRDYYKFCFERNTYEKVISFYYMKNKNEPRQPLLRWLQNNSKTIKSSLGMRFYTNIQGESIVDRICVYENFDEEIKFLADQLGLPEIPELPHAKSKIRIDKRSYSEILTDNERKLISEIFKEELLFHGYSF